MIKKRFRTILADTIHEKTLREHNSESLHCQQGEIISIKEITSQNGSCGSIACENGLLGKIKAQCDSQSYCKLESELLDHCRRLPIKLGVTYSCSEGYSRQNRKRICSDKLNNIWCHSINATIEIEEVSLDYKQRKKSDCVKSRVKILCEGRHICTNETWFHPCLFEDMCVNVHYTCKETNIQTLQTTTLHDKEDTDNLGAATAGSIGAISVVGVVTIVVVWFLCKRVSKNSSDQKRLPVVDYTTQREAFTGSQDIRMPYAKQRASDTVFYSVPKDTYRGVTAEENGGHGYFVFKKEERSTGGISDGRDCEYAMPLNETYHNPEGLMQTLSGDFYIHSTEGIYDQTSNQERISSGEAIYSRSVDGLYDTTASIKRDNSDNLYSHSVDGIYDTTSDTKHRSKNDNLYSHMHSEDVSNDELCQNETSKDVADTYDNIVSAYKTDD